MEWFRIILDEAQFIRTRYVGRHRTWPRLTSCAGRPAQAYPRQDSDPGIDGCFLGHPSRILCESTTQARLSPLLEANVWIQSGHLSTPALRKVPTLQRMGGLQHAHRE